MALANMHSLAHIPSIASSVLAQDYNQAFNELLKPFHTHLSLLPETREGNNTRYRLYDVAIAAFSVFFMQQPSFLAHQRFLEEQQHANNLCNLFGVKSIPSDSQLRRMLDKQSSATLEPIYEAIYEAIFEQLSHRGELEKLRSINNTFLIPLDGVTYHSSKEIYCEQCSHRTDKKEQTIYYTHQAILPVMAAPGVSTVISLPPEFITPQDGADKQDSEIAAAKRWLQRHGPRYIFLGVTFLGDDLFAHQPFCQTVLAAGGHFILTAKPTSHKTLYEWITPLFETAHVTTITQARRKGKKKYIDTYRFINQVPLRDGQDALYVKKRDKYSKNYLFGTTFRYYYT